MSFYERYAEICAKQGLDPCSQKMASTLGVTRATIPTWNTKNTMPKGDTIVTIAEALHVSADYLLCRTDDPTDHTNSSTGSVPDHQCNVDTKKGVAYKKATDTDTENFPRILDLYSQLDYVDRIRVEAYIEGILTGDKYKQNMDKKKQAI